MSRLAIRDPSRRLPAEAGGILADARGGTLSVPDRGVPIHPESLARLVEAMSSGRPLCFAPEVPVASALGLPEWPPLLYWQPATRWSWLRPTSDLDPGDPSFYRLTETTPRERVHYFARHYPRLAPLPKQVSVVVANVCNLSCVMCPYHSPEIKGTHKTGYFTDRQFMPWAMMERIAKECGAGSIPVKMGNIEEPLLHPRLVEFVRRCREAGVPSVHLTTNGTPLNERRIRALLDAGVTSIYVSLDASRRDTYERVRGGDLDRVESRLRAILRLREERRASCSVYVSLVRNDGVSSEEVEEFRDRWLAEADGVILYNLVRYRDGASQLAEIHTQVEDRVREAKGRWACLNPFQEMYILPDGRTYYCCETIGKLAFEELASMGQFPEQSIKGIWAGGGFESLRTDLLTNELTDRSACRTCGIWMAHVSVTEETPRWKTTRNMITEIVEGKRQRTV